MHGYDIKQDGPGHGVDISTSYPLLQHAKRIILHMGLEILPSPVLHSIEKLR